MKRLLALALFLGVAAMLAGCGTASAAENLKIYTAYADNLQTVGARTNPPTFPNPWQGSGKVNFKGAGDKFDTGAIRIENPNGSEASIDQVTVDVGPKHYDLWGSNLKVPANGSLILAQTDMGTKTPPEPNFDTSEPSTTGAVQGSSAVPVIHVKINGNTSDYRDSARILTTGGTDLGSQPGTPNESHQWQLVAAINGGSSASSSLSPLLLFAPLAAMLLGLFSFIPKLIGALILLAIGWWLAKLAARLVIGLLDRVGFGAAAERTGMFGFLGRPGGAATRAGSRPSWVIGQIVKWFVFLIFVELAAEALGLTAITDLLHRIILWIPNLVVALLILFLGALLAQFAGRLVRGTAGSSRVGNPSLLGTIVEYGVIALAAVVALNQLGIATVFVDILFAGVIGALALAAGLAFGLGGREVAGRMWRSTYSTVQRPVNKLPQATPASTPTTPAISTNPRQR